MKSTEMKMLRMICGKMVRDVRKKIDQRRGGRR